MRVFFSILSVPATASAVVAAPNSHNGETPLNDKDSAVPKSIYFMNNEEAENSSITLKVGEQWHALYMIAYFYRGERCLWY